jgi:hypothetical protein
MGDEGLEQPSDSSGKSADSQTGGAESGAVDAPNANMAGSTTVPTDPVLARLVEAWPELPEHIRAAIAALVRAANLDSIEGESVAVGSL